MHPKDNAKFSTSFNAPLGIGILSFAHGHAVAYCDQIATFSDAQVLAAWDSDSERARPHCERFGLQFENSAEKLLARPDIDAVIITSETNRHADLIELAAAAGKAILCQKPMATTLEDCERIIQAVENAGVPFQMAFQMRTDPLNLQIKRWIENGEVGRVNLLRRRHCINFLFNDQLPHSPQAWHIDPVQNVGMFFDDAVHAADFLYWLQGAPVSVMAEIGNVLTTIAPDDTGLAIYRWADGSMASLCNSSVTLAGENTCEIYGDQGVIIQNWDDGVSTPHAPNDAIALKLFRKLDSQWESFRHDLPISHYERLKAIVRPWIDDLLNRTQSENAANARDGKVSVAMCLAAYQSAQSGTRVNL